MCFFRQTLWWKRRWNWSEKSKIKCRNNGSIKQSYFGMLYMGRVRWNSEWTVPPTAVQ
jgi:hypothetical protein